MEFFFDRNIAPMLVHELGQRGITALHHNDQFDNKAGDPEIIEFVSAQQLVLVTYDRRIWREHRDTLEIFRPRIMFLPRSILNSKIEVQKGWFFHGWPRIAEKYGVLTPPAMVRVSASEDVEQIFFTSTLSEE